MRHYFLLAFILGLVAADYDIRIAINPNEQHVNSTKGLIVSGSRLFVLTESTKPRWLPKWAGATTPDNPNIVWELKNIYEDSEGDGSPQYMCNGTIRAPDDFTFVVKNDTANNFYPDFEVEPGTNKGTLFRSNIFDVSFDLPKNLDNCLDANRSRLPGYYVSASLHGAIIGRSQVFPITTPLGLARMKALETERRNATIAGPFKIMEKNAPVNGTISIPVNV